MNEIVTQQERVIPQLVAVRPAPTFSLVPQNMQEAFKLAELIAGSDLAPKDYRGKPGNVLIAVQMGQELGLSPMTSIQSIAVINGKPGLYGDVGKALLLAAGLIIEEDDIEVIAKTSMGRCKITRPGRPPVERTFSVENAKKAGLLGKDGPWKNYPERQLAWRAFWFAARDAASDLLKGLRGAEEIADYQADAQDAPAVMVQPAVPPLLPVYSDDEFALKLPVWRDLIQSGKKTADHVLKTLALKVALTEDQKQQIEALAPEGDAQ